MDKIIIKGLKVFAFHGVYETEKRTGQIFEVDANIYVSLKKAGRTDNIEDTVSYADVVDLILKAMQKENCNLIEKAAANIANEILKKFSTVKLVDVLLKKPLYVHKTFVPEKFHKIKIFFLKYQIKTLLTSILKYHKAVNFTTTL